MTFQELINLRQSVRKYQEKPVENEKIEKLIEVIRVQVYEEHETIYQEIALYKVPTVRLLESDSIEKLIRKHAARILYVGPEFLVIEKTGHKEETQSLFQDLEEFGIIEFVRSGRIAVTKEKMKITHLLEQFNQV